MTKNEDTSPWMHFPDDPKAIKRHNELVLSSIPTADLVTELKGRHELCPVVDEMTREPVCLCVMTTESLVAELSKRDNVTKYPRWVTSEEVFGHRQTLDGKYTMLVVGE